MQGLNPEQIKAIETTEGPVLVLAGAGTGKTRALTTRLAHILYERRANPGEMLAVTFTNKAAREMKTRVSALLGGANVEGWWLGTFHALSARMLRRHAEGVGLRSNFTILDSDDQVRLVKQLMEADGLDAKKANARKVAGMISHWKNKALRPHEVKQNHNKNDDDSIFAPTRVADLYRRYQERLQILNACDFGDLLLHMITLFKDTTNGLLAEYQARFRYILVDEYQDTNVAQYLWLRLLAQKRKNICCVGDDDQSIYGWRGAEVGNILRFEQDFPGAEVIRLERNYRSTGHILNAANGLIAHNGSRLGKNLWTEVDPGEKVRIDGVWDGEQEARLVCERIENHQSKGMPLDEMAILVRASAQMRRFEERMNTLGINYRVVGGPRFYERMEIRDALAYLRLIIQPDDDLAFERIINTPKRGIGKKSVQDLQVAARTMRLSLHETALRLIETDELRPRLRSALRALLEDFARWRAMLDREDHTELAGIVLDESGYTQMWQEEKTPDAEGRLDNLKELVNAMGEFDSLAAFLEHVSLVMDRQQLTDEDQVTLMTLHAAKGLEYDLVFLPGWEEGLFPSQRSLDEKGLEGLEEERRLAYVGLTRARQYAYITHAANRRTYGNWISSVPARFIAELPETDITEESHIRQNSHSAWGSHRQGGQEWRANRFGTHTRAEPTLKQDHKSGNLGGGTRVFHQKFGYGVILNVDGDKLDINFDKAGHKRVIDRFVKPADSV